jgi:hypothetical protein
MYVHLSGRGEKHKILPEAPSRFNSGLFQNWPEIMCSE